MPEGPEIRREADRIAKVLVGHDVEKLHFAFAHLKGFEAQFTHSKVIKVVTRGKALLIEFDNSLSIYSHNQLYGRWYVRKRDDFPNTNRQLRLALHTDQHSALLYSASDIDVLNPSQRKQHAFLKKLGPDLLDPKLSCEAVAQRLQQTRFRRRRLASLLLDQSCLCGPGNYLRSEILFMAGCHPFTRPMDLDQTQCLALATTALELTRRAYITGGITVDPDLVQKLKARGWRRRQYRFYVFARADQDCHFCGGIIVREHHGSRRLYRCETCQSPSSR